MKAAAMTKAQTRRHRWAVLLRVLMATLGGYALTALACAVMAHVLVAVAPCSVHQPCCFPPCSALCSTPQWRFGPSMCAACCA